MYSSHDLSDPRTIPEAELPHNYLLHPARQRLVARVQRGKMRQGHMTDISQNVPLLIIVSGRREMIRSQWCRIGSHLSGK